MQGSVSSCGDDPARGHRDPFPGISPALCTESFCKPNPNPPTDPNSTATRGDLGDVQSFLTTQLTPAAAAASEPRPGSPSFPARTHSRALRHSYLLLTSPQWEKAPCLRPQRKLEGSRGPSGKAWAGPLSQVGVEQKRFRWGPGQIGVQKERPWGGDSHRTPGATSELCSLPTPEAGQ